MCLRCDQVIDLHDDQLNVLKIPFLKIPDFSKTGFLVDDYQVQLRGVCAIVGNRRSSPRSEEDS